ncbi:HD-GYP domain-containing protein [Thermodesulfobacteriota bacterium]
MEKDSIQDKSLTREQLEKYAIDLSKIYDDEKAKRRELASVYEQLGNYAEDLNKNLRALKISHQELQKAYLDTIRRLVLAAEYKDEDTGDHITRMSKYCGLIAEKLGLADEYVERIHYAAPMHDVGKIGIPDHILMKPGKLTDEEFNIIKTHPTIGAKILSGSKAEILNLSEAIARTHHEKWNGTGYPRGLSKTDIPIAGRIVGICDVFDALTSKRPYKEPFPVDKAVDIIMKERGAHFDPEIVDIFMKNMAEILKIKNG